MKGKLSVLIAVILFLTGQFAALPATRQSASAAGPDMAVITELLLNGEEQLALQLVIDTAAELGGWSPAPGDEAVFDPYLSRQVRGTVQDYDDLPECQNPKVSADEAACIEHFLTLERQVRFGPSLFVTPQADGTVQPRPVFDDLLATYIEEVGHSWQEYLYETDGLGSRARTRLTSKVESERWAAGREYQIKRYILSLDGSYITLSDEQCRNLRTQICESYANPLGHEVPRYGAPQGWPIETPTRCQDQNESPQNDQVENPQHKRSVRRWSG